jgi:WD40 repeat protein
MTDRQSYLFYRALHPIEPAALCDELWLVDNGSRYAASATVQAHTIEEALEALRQSLAQKGPLKRYVTLHEDALLQGEIRQGDVLLGERGAWMIGPAGEIKPIRYSATLATRTYAGHRAMIERVCWSSDGRIVAASDGAGSVLLHQPSADFPARYERHGTHPVTALGWSPVGARVASGDSRNEVHIWQVAEWQTADASIGPVVICRPGQGNVAERYRTITCLSWHPTGRSLLVGREDGLIALCDAATGQVTHQHMQHNGRINEVAWSPDGKHALSASEEGTLALLMGSDVLSQVRSLPHAGPVVAAAWSPDGERLVSAVREDLSLYVWEVQSGDCLCHPHLSLSYARPLSANALAWSPDGRIIAAACSDGTTQMFDAEQGCHTRSLRTYHDRASATAVAFCPRGDALATGYDDGGNGSSTVRAWKREIL